MFSLSVKKICLFAFLQILLCCSAHAGGKYIGKVKPYFWGGGLYLAPVNSVKSDVPTCATRDLLRLEEGADNQIFQYKFSILLAAWMAEKDVELWGSGNNNNNNGNNGTSKNLTLMTRCKGR